MARHIGIVGAGIAGLHLALYLQKHGVDATLITDRAPEDYRNIRLLNTVAHHHVTIAREDYLGVNHWTDPKDHYYYHDHFFNFPQPLGFRGDFSRPSRAVDYRIYLPALMKDFARRGGKIEYRRIEESDIASAGRPLRSPGRVDRQGAARSALHLPAGAHALFAAAAAAVRRSLHRRAAARSDERDAFGVARPWRDDRDPDHHFRRRRQRAADGERAGRRHGGTGDAELRRRPEALPARAAGASSRSITRRPTTGSTPRASISRSRRICCRAAWCRRCATRSSSSTTANAPSRSATSIRSSIPMMGQGANVASYAAFVLGEEIVNSDVLDARFCEKVDLQAAGPRAGGVALDQHHAAAADGSAGHADRHDEPEPGAGQRVHREFQLSGSPVGSRLRRPNASMPGSGGCRRLRSRCGPSREDHRCIA